MSLGENMNKFARDMTIHYLKHFDITDPKENYTNDGAAFEELERLYGLKTALMDRFTIDEDETIPDENYNF